MFTSIAGRAVVVTGAEASYVLADVSRREDCQQIAAAAAAIC